MALVLSLSDSLLSAHKSFGTQQLQLRDSGESFDACICIASGCSLMMPWDLRMKEPEAAVSIALRTIESGHPMIKRHLAGNPPVRVIVVNSRRAMPYCRKHEEQCPRLVSCRQRSPLVTNLETPWTICDLDDVVSQRVERRKFDELEVCKLRHEKGMFSETDYNHLRRDVGKDAVREIIKATRRTALSRHGEPLKDDGIVLVLAAGWNVEDYPYANLDSFGKAWLRADIVASAELCALDGHPISAVMKKLRELAGRMRGNHSSFLRQSIGSIKKLRPPAQFQRALLRKRTRAGSSGCGKRCKKEDAESFPFAGKYIGNWYGKDQVVVIYQDWTYTIPGCVDHGRVTKVVPKKNIVSDGAAYRLTRSDKRGSNAHLFGFIGSKAYGVYDQPLELLVGDPIWTLVKADACLKI